MPGRLAEAAGGGERSRTVIHLDKGKVAAFTNDDLDAVNAVDAQVAIALENVNALERLTRGA